MGIFGQSKTRQQQLDAQEAAAMGTPRKKAKKKAKKKAAKKRR